MFFNKKTTTKTKLVRSLPYKSVSRTESPTTLITKHEGITHANMIKTFNLTIITGQHYTQWLEDNMQEIKKIGISEIAIRAEAFITNYMHARGDAFKLDANARCQNDDLLRVSSIKNLDWNIIESSGFATVLQIVKGKFIDSYKKCISMADHTDDSTQRNALIKATGLTWELIADEEQTIQMCATIYMRIIAAIELNIVNSQTELAFIQNLLTVMSYVNTYGGCYNSICLSKTMSIMKLHCIVAKTLECDKKELIQSIDELWIKRFCNPLLVESKGLFASYIPDLDRYQTQNLSLDLSSIGAVSTSVISEKHTSAMLRIHFYQKLAEYCDMTFEADIDRFYYYASGAWGEHTLTLFNSYENNREDRDYWEEHYSPDGYVVNVMFQVYSFLILLALCLAMVIWHGAVHYSYWQERGVDFTSLISLIIVAEGVLLTLYTNTYYENWTWFDMLRGQVTKTEWSKLPGSMRTERKKIALLQLLSERKAWAMGLNTKDSCYLLHAGQGKVTGPGKLSVSELKKLKYTVLYDTQQNISCRYTGEIEMGNLFLKGKRQGNQFHLDTKGTISTLLLEIWKEDWLVGANQPLIARKGY
jgi:hypothetical protein